MKPILTPIRALLLCAVLASGCTALEQPSCGGSGQEIAFLTEDGLDVDTKAMSERTSATGFTCMATRADGSVFIGNVQTVTSGGRQVVSGRYWPASGTLSFYGVLPNVNCSCSSGSVSFPVGTSSSPLTGTEDYIAASAKNVANATSPVPMAFGHILANISGMVFVGPRSGASTTVTAVSVSMPRYGTYNATSGSWSGLGAAQSVSFPKPSAVISGTGSVSAAADYSLIPGTCTISVSYTVQVGPVSRSYTRSASVTLAAGKRSTVTVTLTDDFRDLGVSVSVKPWVTASGWTEHFEGGEPTPEWSVRTGALWDQVDLTYNGDTVWASCIEDEDDCFATMEITFSGYSTFTFYVMSSSETDYDFAAVSDLDFDLAAHIDEEYGYWDSYFIREEADGVHQIIEGDPSLDDPCDQDCYTPVTFTGLDPQTTYWVQVVYGKDGSVSRGLDRAFVFIP